MSFKKILVPYDGSRLSNNAFKFALNLAKFTNSKIVILDCINTAFKGDMIPKADFDFAGLVLKKLRTKAKNDMKKLEKLAKKENIPIKSFVIDSSSIANSIISFAKTKKIDLIVLAPHSQNRFSEFFLGSVSNAVIHQTKIPILLVK